MSGAAVFKSVSGINCAIGREPSPVRALEPLDSSVAFRPYLALSKDLRTNVDRSDPVYTSHILR